MFGKSIHLFKLLGFEVKIDLSWIIIAVLIAWSLSTGLFPLQFKNLSTQAYWIMGIIGAIGLFVSIILHEFSHSLMARKYGMPMKGITLFIFGGMAEMSDEPTSPKAEFMMAVVGPLSSLAIGIGFYLLLVLGEQVGWPKPVNGVLGYLALINGLLAAFNTIPAFPLDGGRILRSIFWGWKKNIRWATKVTSQIGRGFGILLIIFGVYNFLRGYYISGMWWFLIGMFIQGAAKMSYQQLVTRKALEGEKVSRFMKENPVTVSPSLTVDKLVEDYIYEHHFKMFPVVEDNNQLRGCVTTKDVKEVPREEWGNKTVQDIARECTGENTINGEDDAMKALSRMNQTGSSRLMVVDDGHLAGIIALKDMMKFLSLKVELDESEQS
jgi:Zn-dependent protease/CBS domain-containing protein